MLKKKFKIAIAEDDEYYNKVLAKSIQELCDSGDYPMLDCEVTSYLSGQKCADNLDADTQVLVLDHYLDNRSDSFFNAFDVMKVIEEKCKDCKVIVMSGQRNKEVASKLLIKGAFLYIDKETEGPGRLQEEVRKIMDAHKWPVSLAQ